jgi:succinate-semialdehyde dehydrogenase / glutarate-semialdehyde dehydrogenase
MAISSINPATGERLRSFQAHDHAEVEARVSRAVTAQRAWRTISLEDRAARMRVVAGILEEDTNTFARLMTLEMGKPIAAARAEAEKCAWVCRFYAEHAAAFLAREQVETDATRSWIEYQPMGLVLAIMPWNFPFWQVFRFAAPAIMAGNAGLLKHAANVPQCALAIEEVFRRAGFDDGIFSTLLIESDRVAAVIADPRIAAVTLTGSEGAGRAVGEGAGRALRKSVLELGGSDPFIVMPSADLEMAVTTAVKARMINNGQSCIAAKRFIVHERIAGEFERAFVEGVKALQVGDPMNERVDIGPLATEGIRDGVARQVEETVAAGARVLTGGHRRDGTGWYFEPTVLVDAAPGTPAYTEEIFGPVATLFRVPGLDEAIRLANDVRFGLGASAWTTDAAERDRFTSELEAGLVFINAMVASDPRLPFGGVKHSGYGRELGVHGIREFVNVKSVWIGGSERTSETE